LYIRPIVCDEEWVYHNKNSDENQEERVEGTHPPSREAIPVPSFVVKTSTGRREEKIAL